MSGFSNPLINASDALIRTSVHSPNFAPGSGWSINKDGTATFNELVITISSSGVAVLIYSGVPASGNLIGSWASVAGQDPYGNPYPIGLNANQGTLTGMLLSVPQIIGGTIANALLTAPNITSMNATGGQCQQTTIVFNTSGGSLFAYGTTTTTVTLTPGSTYPWVAPITGNAQIVCFGADAGAGGGNATQGGEGGGAGECGWEPAYPLVNGQGYDFNVGSAGSGGATGTAGSSGGDTEFDNFNIYAQGGQAGFNFIGGLGGNASTNTNHHPGGNGGGDGTQSTGGCGGGGRAGTTGPGANGSKSTSSVGANGGTAGTGIGGHAGGNGGNAAANGNNGGAGGGCGAATSATSGSNQYRLASSATYYGSDGSSPNGQRSTGTMYQGGETAGGGSFNGTQKSLGIISGNPVSDLAGKTIDSVHVRLENLHSWYNSGMTVYLGYNNRTSLPGSWNGSDIVSVLSYHINEGATLNQDVSNHGLGSALQSGAAKAITLGPGSGAFNLTNYGYFYGAGGDNNQNPLITVNWHTGASPVIAGSGQDGQIQITYQSTSQLVCSVSPIATTDPAGNTIPAGFMGPIRAIQPSSSPQVPETWHDLRPLLNSFVGTNTSQYPTQYRLNAQGNVEVFGVIKLPTTYTGVTWQTLPVGYRPLTNQIANSGLVIESNGTSNLVSTPYMSIDTSGNMQFHNFPTGLAGTLVFVHVTFPLENTGLITS